MSNDHKAILQEAYQAAYEEGREQARERGRQIFYSPEAKGKFKQAVELFSQEDLTAEACIKLLATCPLDADAATNKFAITDAAVAAAWAKAAARRQ
jgi:hypothetical protein